MSTPKYIDDLMQAPRGSILVGTLASKDKEGVETTSAIVEGTPSGFRALAGVLLKMADKVEAATDDLGWGLVLHPDDIPGLETLGVASISLGCQRTRD